MQRTGILANVAEHTDHLPPTDIPEYSPITLSLIMEDRSIPVMYLCLSWPLHMAPVSRISVIAVILRIFFFSQIYPLGSEGSVDLKKDFRFFSFFYSHVIYFIDYKIYF